jgi:hypothetical protein
MIGETMWCEDDECPNTADYRAVCGASESFACVEHLGSIGVFSCLREHRRVEKDQAAGAIAMRTRFDSFTVVSL